MSVSSAVVDVCDFWVDTGRGWLGMQPLLPQLLKFKFSKPPKVREAVEIEIETRRTRLLFLRARQGGEILYEGPVPAEGMITIIPLTPEPIEFQITLEPRHPAGRPQRHESVLEPAPNGPAIERFDAPASVTLGDGIGCGWAAPRAGQVRLAVIQDGAVADHIGTPIGELVVPAPRPGKVLLRLTAEASWGQSTVTRKVTVVAPQLKLILLRPAFQVARPGETVRFEWRTMAAESAWLVPPGAAAPEPLRDKTGGFLDITLGSRVVEFQVIARGYGGAERRVVLRAVPDPIACLETGHE